jgi:hypothetical protein
MTSSSTSVIVTTDADRGAVSNRPISPNTWPAPRTVRMNSFPSDDVVTILTRPLTTTKTASASSPS